MLASRKPKADSLLRALARHSNELRSQAATRQLRMGHLRLACALLLLAVCLQPVKAEQEEKLAQQVFEVRSAFLERQDDVYQLNATLAFELPEGARQAIIDGVAMTLDLEIVLRRSRRFWLDENVATLVQNYQLEHRVLSERYLVRNVNSGEQISFPTLDTALNSLRVITDLPILDQSLIEPDNEYEISLRASLDVRTMPDALRFVLFLADDWRQRSERYIWSPRL
jgi:hypothetical protein